MANVALAWQLGTGLGHLAQMLPLAEGLLRSGHNVIVVFRDLVRAATLYGRTGVSLIQSPVKLDRAKPFPRGVSFAHLLGNTGFGSNTELFALGCAWRNIFRLTRPDLIVADHSPIALLASRGLPARRALIGSGFCCPPDTTPLPILRPRADTPIEQVVADEGRLLARANWLLGLWKQPPLDHLGQIYGEVDERFLTTFPELDHYGVRPGVRYWGPVNGSGGKAPEWPGDGKGPRVAAYLKSFPALTTLLDILARRGLPTLIFSQAISRETRERYASARNIRFERERLDPALVARDCDVAILNATHGTTCDMLLAGKPVLQFPLQAEQEMGAARVEGLGAGLTLDARRREPELIEQGLDRILSDARFRDAARSFADRHADFDSNAERAALLERALELLAMPPGTASRVNAAMVKTS